MTRVAFVDRDPPSGFLALDRECLEASFEVERLVYPGRTNCRYLRETWQAARACEAMCVFFASEHALLPVLIFKLRRRRVVLVPGGYDYANVPERHYGLAARGRGGLPKLIGRMADVALPLSRQTQAEFLSLVPSAAKRTFLGYLAVDPRKWGDLGIERDPSQVVTVGYIDEEAWSRKGIDRFVACATDDPGRSYVLVGRMVPSIVQRITSHAPPNLRLAGHLPHEELRRLLWSSGVYAQLSWHETFGVAMAEAMLCGCVPVITPLPALREVAGNWAVCVRAEESDVDAVRRAAGTTIDRSAMRCDVATRFSPLNRRRLLADAVNGSL